MTARFGVIREYQRDRPSRSHPRPVWELRLPHHHTNQAVRPPPFVPLASSLHISAETLAETLAERGRGERHAAVRDQQFAIY